MSRKSDRQYRKDLETLKNQKDIANLGPGFVTIVTPKAMLFVLESDQKEHWIPLSILPDRTAGYCRQYDTLDPVLVPTWFAEKEELEVPES